MKAFTDGFTALEKAKKDEKEIQVEAQLLSTSADIQTSNKKLPGAQKEISLSSLSQQKKT